MPIRTEKLYQVALSNAGTWNDERLLRAIEQEEALQGAESANVKLLAFRAELDRRTTTDNA